MKNSQALPTPALQSSPLLPRNSVRLQYKKLNVNKNLHCIWLTLFLVWFVSICLCFTKKNLFNFWEEGILTGVLPQGWTDTKPSRKDSWGKKKPHLRQAISLGYQNPGESEGSYSFSVLQGAGEHFSCWLSSEDALMSFWIRAINHKAQLKAGMYPEPCSYCLYTAASEMFP